MNRTDGEVNMATASELNGRFPLIPARSRWERGRVSGGDPSP